MHRYPVDADVAGERVTPLALAAELDNYASEVNGRLDRENFNPGKAGMADSRLVVGAINHILYGTGPAGGAAQTIVLTDAGVANGKTEWVESTFAAISFTSPEETLHVETGCAYHVGAHGAVGNYRRMLVAFGVKVDEDIYFQAPERVGAEYDMAHIDVQVPVIAGTHRAVPVFRLLQTDQGAGSESLTITVDHVQTMIREARR